MVMDSNSGRYFEDYIIGVEGEVGGVSISEAEVFDARRSNSKPDRGLIHTSVKVCNQDSVMVMTMKAINVVACRRPQMT
jgi:hypothetical protein